MTPSPIDLTPTQAVMGLCALGAGLYVLVGVLKRILPERVTCSRAWARSLPVLAALLGALLAPLIARGWTLQGIPMSHLTNALAGLVAGQLSGGLYSVIAQTLLGKDTRIGQDAPAHEEACEP